MTTESITVTVSVPEERINALRDIEARLNQADSLFAWGRSIEGEAVLAEQMERIEKFEQLPLDEKLAALSEALPTEDNNGGE